MDNKQLRIDLLRKIYDLEQTGVSLSNIQAIAIRDDQPIERLIFEHARLQKKYENLCEDKTHSYKNLSHFVDMLKNMSNEPNKNIPYTDKQFEEDLKKWIM